MPLPPAVDANFMHRLERIAWMFISRPPENDYQRGHVRMLYDIMTAATNGATNPVAERMQEEATKNLMDFQRAHQLRGHIL